MEQAAGSPLRRLTGPVGRLWRGDCSLAVAYWIWGLVFAMVLLFGMLLLFATAISARGGSTLLESAALVGVLTVAVIVPAWSVLWWVGCWRAATRYTGRRLWAWGAKGTVVFSVVQACVGIGEMALASVRTAVGA